MKFGARVFNSLNNQEYKVIYRGIIYGQSRCKVPILSEIYLVKRYGLGSTGHQRYRCQDCCRTFQLD